MEANTSTAFRGRFLAHAAGALLDMTDTERVRWIGSLEKHDPAQAAELADLLRDRAGLGAGPSTPAPSRPAPAPGGRSRLATAGLAVLALVALLGGLAGIGFPPRAAAWNRDLSLTRLERAERLAAERFAPDDPAGVDALVTVGSIDLARGESVRARRVLERAFAASLRVSDPGVRAHAQCAWARALAAGDPGRARGLVVEAIAFLPAEARFDGVAAQCRLGEASIASDAGDADGARSAAQAGLDRLAGHDAAYPATRAELQRLLTAPARRRTAGR